MKDEIVKYFCQSFIENDEALIEFLNDYYYDEAKLEEAISTVKEIAKECGAVLTDSFVIYRESGETYYGVKFAKDYWDSPIGTVIKEL